MVHLDSSVWVAYAAALWALIFAIFHVIWAFGWYVGLDHEQARIAFGKPFFFAYDLVVAGMCALAVLVALAPVQKWGRRLPRRLVGFCAWTGTVLLVLRAGGSLVQTAYLLIVGPLHNRGHGHLGAMVLPWGHPVRTYHLALLAPA